MCIYLSFITCSSVDGHLSWYNFLVIVNIVALNMDEQVSLQYNTDFLGHMSRGNIAMPYDRSSLACWETPRVLPKPLY